MNGLVFEKQSPPKASAPNRTDIACFVGFVRRREGVALSPEVKRWLYEQGWTAGSSDMEAGQENRLPYARSIGDIEGLLDVPVPIESWDAFDGLFAWEQRPMDLQDQLGGSYLGAAVRSFFAQGGRKCYVVRVGDPWAYTAGRAERTDRLGGLIPGFPISNSSSPVDRNSWRGVAHIFGLPDVSFVSMPDLADAVRVEAVETLPPVVFPPIAEQFVECSDDEPDTAPDSSVRLLRAPRCDAEGYETWARALHLVAELIARYRREVHLIAAVPIPYTPLASEFGSDDMESDLLELLTGGESSPLGYGLQQKALGISSAFVQLAYPWVKRPGSNELPESLESPDAVLTGILARNALAKGTYFSAAGLHLADVYEVFPILRQDSMQQERPDNAEAETSHSLLERVSLMGPTPDGLRLMSDVTASLDKSHRPACVSRLIASVLRAARRMGEDSAFEVSGERLWGRLTDRMSNLLLGLYQAGALRGSRSAEAFNVRCDRTTMTQTDIDSGRVIAQVVLSPSTPIDQITVAMVLNDGGQVSLAAVS